MPSPITISSTLCYLSPTQLFIRYYLLFLKSSPPTTYETYVFYCLQYFEMRVQPILLVVVWAAVVVSDDPFTCYWIDGTAVPGLFPCEQTGVTMCCDGRYDIKDECIGNGLCRNVFATGVPAPNGDRNSYWRSGCTDKTWKSDACVPLAPCKKPYRLSLSV